MIDDMFIINHNSDIKDAFGSYAILDQFEVCDHPAIYQFARIVTNYLKMQHAIEELEKENNE